MKVRTHLIAGETPNMQAAAPDQIANTIRELYSMANMVVDNALVDPNALKLFMNYLPPADQ